VENKIQTEVFNELAPIISNLGYELVEVEYEKKENGMNLTLFIDRAEGITIEDCQVVARAVDEPLDKLNPTKDEHYYLNVSSLGLDRPLKTEKDFLRALNKELEITYNTPKGQKTIKGVLKNIEQQKITINEKGKLVTIELVNVSDALPVIKF
jgi:ribosome maturation factor RimP